MSLHLLQAAALPNWAVHPAHVIGIVASSFQMSNKENEDENESINAAEVAMTVVVAAAGFKSLGDDCKLNVVRQGPVDNLINVLRV